MVMLFLETLLFLADLTLDQSAHAMGLHSIKNGPNFQRLLFGDAYVN